MEPTEQLRRIPKVDRLLEEPEVKELLKSLPRKQVVSRIQVQLEELRKGILEGKVSDFSYDSVKGKILLDLERAKRPRLVPVINATGVVVHTNLGRSPLPRTLVEELMDIACGYSNLEYDLSEGKRGNRFTHVEGILKELTGAEAATVVNNNAAAVLLSLDTIAKGKEVIVSRGELIEIGGSFRIPEVMKRSGAKLVEVGTTNKTKLSDYEQAITSDTGLLLKVHTSNYKIIGFTQSVEGESLVELGRRYGIPVMEDLGSGCFVDLSQFGYEKEPTVQEVVAEGVDIVTFSGDKLLGGPQAGIIVGKKELVERIRKNQLARALRIDKLTLFSLEWILRIYLDQEKALKTIPTLQMITATYEVLIRKAKAILKKVGKQDSASLSISIREGSSKVGGGALPALNLKTALICITPKKLKVQEMEEFFRNYDPPIIVRVERDSILMDVRTILAKDEKHVVEAIKKLALF